MAPLVVWYECRVTEENAAPARRETRRDSDGLLTLCDDVSQRCGRASSVEECWR
jgi:hypothetical protein